MCDNANPLFLCHASEVRATLQHAVPWVQVCPTRGPSQPPCAARAPRSAPRVDATRTHGPPASACTFSKPGRVLTSPGEYPKGQLIRHDSGPPPRGPSPPGLRGWVSESMFARRGGVSIFHGPRLAALQTAIAFRAKCDLSTHPHHARAATAMPHHGAAGGAGATRFVPLRFPWPRHRPPSIKRAVLVV